MRLHYVTGRGWLHQVWRHKAALLTGFLGIASLSLAHYAGFLIKVPLQIVAVAGVPLAKGVTATFLFYVFFCAIFARVLTSILQLFVLPWLAVADRMASGFHIRLNWSRRRRFVRTHTQTIKWEGSFWLATQAFLFLLLMLTIYVRLTMTEKSVAALSIAVVLVLLCGLFRAGFFLQLKPGVFIRKIKTRRTRSGLAVSAGIATAAAALVVMAFFMGSMRAQLLRDQESHIVVTKDFTGTATVIGSSEGALLLYQKNGSEFRYIYSAPDFSAAFESKSVFPPFAPKKDPK